jgi:hypothetical protein
MMKRLHITVVLAMSLAQAMAQPVAQVEAGYWHFPIIDDIFRTYQLAHPWSNAEVAPIGMGLGVAAGWNQRLFAPRSLHAIGLVHYRHQTTSWKNSSVPLKAGFHSAELEVLIRSHPRCLTQDVQNTGPLGTRWYVQLGGGYNWNVPFARKYGERVTIANDKRYSSVSGQLSASAGTGLHAFTIGSLIFTLETTVTWFPRFTLDGFATAVLGHNETSLPEEALNCMLLQGNIRITHQKKTKNWWDAPRSGDKS